MKTESSYSFVDDVLNATFKILESKSQAKNLYKIDVVMTFLAKFVGTLAYRSLTIKLSDKLSNKEKGIKIQENYLNLKMAVQEAISSGFTSAMDKFSGKGLEYYCDIRPVGIPKNKKDV